MINVIPLRPSSALRYVMIYVMHFFFAQLYDFMQNIIPALPALSKIKLTAPVNEIEQYHSEPCMVVNDVLVWWYKQRAIYSCLSHMTLNFLSIPHMFSSLHCPHSALTNAYTLATSVNAEHLPSLPPPTPHLQPHDWTDNINACLSPFLDPDGAC